MRLEPQRVCRNHRIDPRAPCRITFQAAPYRHGSCRHRRRPRWCESKVMSLNDIVERLIEDSTSTSSFCRAIRLFEFQVAVFHPGSFGKLVASEANERAPTRILRTARIFAASKILEKIEAELKEEKKKSEISIQELAANEDYRRLFDGVFAANGGCLRLRGSMSATAFDDKIVARCDEALAVANIVDFSYRLLPCTEPVFDILRKRILEAWKPLSTSLGLRAPTRPLWATVQ